MNLKQLKRTIEKLEDVNENFHNFKENLNDKNYV